MRNIFITFLVSMTIVSAAILPNLVYASSTASRAEVCLGVGVISGNGSCDSVKSSGSSIDNILSLILNLFSAIVGLIAVIMIIVGGVKYVTSAGSSEKTNDAKNAILYAVIGLVIVALAQIIVRFVLHKAYKL